MAERAITDQNFGAWVLKCNPQTWDLAQWVADGNTLIDNWSVQDNYRSERMQPGDPAVLWVTGSGAAGVAPGVWGTGHVVGAPWRVLGSGGDYWLDLDAADRVTLIVGLDIVVTELVVSRSVLRADPRLASCEIFRSPQMGNPSWLNKDEWSALQDYLGDDVPEPFDSVTSKALRADEADALERNPLVRALVEKAAVTAVRYVLEADGYSVDDVQKDNVGWDL